ncbi:MAG: hypothetical protein AB1630_01575 [bacterium]
MNWKEKDKKVRDVLVKRLFLLREKIEEILRKKEHKGNLKEANNTLSLIKAIDMCLDEIRFTNYGYSDFEIKDYETIEEKQREIFETLEEIENSDFTHIRDVKERIENLKKDYAEIKSLIMALIPHKKNEIIEDR